jgi:pterin-4a-carbinolamine dehydratase
VRSQRVSSLLREYFENEVQPQHFTREFSLDTRSLPVVPRNNSAWRFERSPERLCRTYEFPDRSTMRSFLDQLMDYEDRCQHHGKVQVEGSTVHIEVRTHDLDRVTEIDKEYANECDMIQEDMGMRWR